MVKVQKRKMRELENCQTVQYTVRINQQLGSYWDLMPNKSVLMEIELN